MREMALECLLKVLRSLVRWHSDIQVSGTKSIDVSFTVENGVSDDSQIDSTNQIAHVKQKKGFIESGVELFAKHPKQGLAFLQRKGFIGDSADDIASFFHSEERLDKTVVGDYLGDGNEFVKRIFFPLKPYF